MKVHAEPESIKLLRQIYADVCKTGEISFKTSMKVTDFFMNLSDLASVEPEPLAKNKQTENKCDNVKHHNLDVTNHGHCGECCGTEIIPT